jgi:uncharacterized protein YebE (UPF0316 family)
MDTNFFQTEIYTYLVLPVLIFLARITDVTIGTMRLILVSRGRKIIVPLLGFFEVLIWILALSRIMQNLDNIICYFAYAGGFASGNYIGMLLEEKLALGDILIRVITQKDATNLIKSLQEKGYGTTSVEARGLKDKVHIIFTIIKRVEIKKVVDIIHTFNPKAFFSIEDLRFVEHGIFPPKPTHFSLRKHPLRRWRKGK